MLHILFLLTSLFTFAHDASAKDFCVADLKGPDSPSGYPCKSLKDITVDDFVSSTLNSPGISLNNSNVTAAFVSRFPGLNGLDLSIGHATSAPGGFFPMHSHPDATEVIYQMSGSFIAGFISSANTVFIKTLQKGDLMVLPQGLFHFVMNAADDQQAEGVFFFNNPNPSVQIMDYSLFGNDLDSALIEKTTSISKAEVERLKAIFNKKA